MSRPRARDIGLVIGDLPPGPHNAITDVADVRVGHTTIRRPPDLHTGVTAIVPGEVGPRNPLPTAMFAGNGYGKLVGVTQLDELGRLETPIVLTSTLSVFRAADALVGWMLERPDCADVRSLNPVVGECNDGFLSDIRSRPIRDSHVRAALEGAVSGPVPEGCVGAGTGTCALGFKAGIGTASRTPVVADARVTVGALVQANFGGTLRVRGRLVTPEQGTTPPVSDASATADADPPDDGSCMIVVATDSALDARQLKRVARRAVFALARVGASYAGGSGDYGIAFSTIPTASSSAASDRAEATAVRPLEDGDLNPLFEAVLDVVEESVLNSLLAATTTTGFGGSTRYAVDPAAL